MRYRQRRWGASGVYVYELARDLGAEPRELIEQAALEDMGHLAPNSDLTQEQAARLRDSYIRAHSSSRGSLFAHGAAAAAGATPPTTDPPAPSSAPSPQSPPDPPAAPFEPPPAPGDPHPVVEPGSAAPIEGPLSGAGLGQPLGFTPPGQTAPRPASSPSTPRPAAAPAAPNEPRWEDTAPLWEPLPQTVSIGGPTSYDEPPQPPQPRQREDYSQPREYHYDPSQAERPLPEPRRSESTLTRSVVLGIVGLIVIVLASMYVGRRLDIIGPGAERNCVLLTTPVVDGEGTFEEIVCIDGYGDEVRREVLSQGTDDAGIQFGSTVDGATTRVVQVEDFCRGASDFRSFREGLLGEVADAPSMASVGSWYDVNDGFGEAGVGRMLGSFGNAGPNPAVQQLESYLSDVHEAARARTVPQAQMLLGAAEGAYVDAIVAVRNFAGNNC